MLKAGSNVTLGGAALGRIQMLDVLRGLAALSVVLFHYSSRFAELHGNSPAPFELKFGHYGVDLFFMISGFVIAMTLERSGAGLDFTVSRFSRLYPAYWVAVLISYFTIRLYGEGALPKWHLTWADLAWNMTMLQAFAHRPSVDGAYWTLAVELRFYVLMFVCHLIGLTRKIGLLVGAWLSLSLAYAFMPGFVQVNFILESFPMFAVGILAFQARRNGWKFNYIGLAAFALFVNYYLQGAEAALIAALLAMIFVISLNFKDFEVHPVFIWLGAISYPLYLIHQNIGYIILFNERSVVGWLSAIALSLAVASLIHYLIEDPAMQSIRRHYKSWRLSRSNSAVSPQ